jgi:hypothetical protein
MIGKDKSIIRLRSDPEEFGETPDQLEAEDFSSDVPVQHTHWYSMPAMRSLFQKG